MCIRDRWYTMPRPGPGANPTVRGWARPGAQRSGSWQWVAVRKCSEGYWPLRAWCLSRVPGRRDGITNRSDMVSFHSPYSALIPVSYTHLRAHETPEHLVCRLLLEKKKNRQ
eukprot:TRINITY_DN29093_c0_g1_i1.p1 TRINITY_DN29093_c0_g1~~TRINITY_DN29093_c0_g1_i1.p1  ORF type:complete len:112 (-),score=17.05 TRINITY_DN29093_c0_g1_i1:21-356(-)